VAYPIVNQLYHATIAAMAHAGSQLTLTENTALDRWIGYLDTVTVKVFFFGILCLFLLSYILKFVEWAVFVKKV